MLILCPTCFVFLVIIIQLISVYIWISEFHLGPSQKALLTSALSSSTDNPDRKYVITCTHS